MRRYHIHPLGPHLQTQPEASAFYKHTPVLPGVCLLPSSPVFHTVSSELLLSWQPVKVLSSAVPSNAASLPTHMQAPPWRASICCLQARNVPLLLRWPCWARIVALHSHPVSLWMLTPLLVLALYLFFSCCLPYQWISEHFSEAKEEFPPPPWQNKTPAICSEDQTGHVLGFICTNFTVTYQKNRESWVDVQESVLQILNHSNRLKSADSVKTLCFKIWG